MINKVLVEDYEKSGNIKKFYQTVLYAWKVYNISQIRTKLSVRQAFCKTGTHHILIPVCIFFILGSQIAPSKESRMHV